MENPHPLRFITGSILFRVVTLGFLSLLLLAPLESVRELVRERQRLRSAAVDSVAAGWGGEQTILGPALVVQAGCHDKDEDGAPLRTRHLAVKLPENLRLDGASTSEIRERGIHRVPVFRARLHVAFAITPPAISELDWQCDRTEVEAASIVLALDDSRGIDSLSPLAMEGAGPESWVAGTPLDSEWRSGVQAALDVSRLYPGGKAAAKIPMSFDLEFRGSERLWFAPAGSPTTVRLASDWPDPSFNGSFLPTSHELRADGFDAEWKVSELARPVLSLSLDRAPSDLRASAFGLTWFQPADAYLRAERSLKYGFLFVVLTFLTFFLFELTGMRRAHFLQYGLVGGALCVFYLLLLSLSEHVAYETAYLVAAVATAGQITLYGRAFLASAKRTFVLGTVLSTLYGCLYLLVGLEEAALLIGSIGLFVVIAITMWLTREVNREPRAPAPTGAIPSANS
jgi:inner membrane protein